MSEGRLWLWLSLNVALGRAWASLALCVVLLVAAVSASAQTCTGVTYRTHSPRGYTQLSHGPTYVATDTLGGRNAACEAGIASWGPPAAQLAFAGQPATNHGATPAASGAYQSGSCSFNLHADVEGAGIVNVGGLASLEVLFNQCPPPRPPCDPNFLGVGDSFTSSTYPGADGYCHALSNCKISVQSSSGAGGETLYNWRHTSEDCGADAPPPDDDLDQGDACASTAGGNEWCLAKDGQNCGWLNGHFTCLPQIDDDGCDVFSDSSRVCGPEAPTPPVPDNGTPGQPAPPDDTIHVNDPANPTQVTNVYNYYGPTTVGGSARPPGSSGDNPYDGDDDGDGSGPVEGPGDDDGIDDDGCTEADGCTGTLPTIGEAGDCESFGACLSSFWTRLGNAPIIASVANAGSAFPVGACPSANITMFGETNSLTDPMCNLWTGSIAPVIGVMFLVMFAWISTRVVLSA